MKMNTLKSTASKDQLQAGIELNGSIAGDCAFGGMGNRMTASELNATPRLRNTVQNPALKRGGSPTVTPTGIASFRTDETADRRASQEAKEANSAGGRKEMWARVKKKLRIQLGEDVYLSWFNGLTMENIEDGVASFSVPTRFLQQWIENHYGERILALLQEEKDDISNIVISVRGALHNRAKPVQAGNHEPRAAALPSPMTRMDDGRARRLCDITGPHGGAPLDPRYTFASFCEGSGNNMAFTAAKAIATGDRTVNFNPLFIHAKVGLGKTHLLQAIAWESQRAKLPRRVLYFTSERFMHKLREGFVNKTIAEIKDRLRDVDVMIIDDIQFLAGDKFQLEFSHLINSLIDANKQVIVSADRPAAELKTLDDRILSRLRGGIALQLDAPDTDLRRKILLSRLSALRNADPSIMIPDVVLDYVAQAVKTNGRDLEGALNRLVAQQCFTSSPVTLESAQLVLRDLVRCDEPRKVMIEDIQRLVSNHFNISKSDLVSQRRTRAIVRPRQIAMYLSKTMTPRSLPEIGKRFGGRDHTTVIHAVQKIEQLMSEDRGFSDDVELLRRLLND